MTLDFAICDPDGKPKFAVEYQGGYHQSAEQHKKDEFKRKLLAEVGISLRDVDSKELTHFEDE